MMYNTRYLLESFEWCGHEKTILWHFPYSFNKRPRWNALIKDGSHIPWKGLLGTSIVLKLSFHL